jgi:hypothetical protein
LEKNYNYEYSSSPKKNYGDIKEQLRKIYNIKPQPNRPPRKLVELPRIHQ